MVGRLVGAILRLGVAVEDLGVICLYKAQVAAIKQVGGWCSWGETPGWVDVS